MRCQTNREIVEKFVDRTAGENTAGNRLRTIENENGNVILVGHQWNTLAEYNEARGVVTVYTGHTSVNSPTTNRYLNLVTSVAEERGRDVVISGESPIHDTPTEATKYIKNYVGQGPKSPVEKDAMADVYEELTA
jgi:N-acetyl-beta-hexosaminidase